MQILKIFRCHGIARVGFKCRRVPDEEKAAFVGLCRKIGHDINKTGAEALTTCFKVFTPLYALQRISTGMAICRRAGEMLSTSRSCLCGPC